MDKQRFLSLQTYRVSGSKPRLVRCIAVTRRGRQYDPVVLIGLQRNPDRSATTDQGDVAVTLLQFFGLSGADFNAQAGPPIPRSFESRD